MGNVRHSRYTSPVHAGARFVAQRGLLKPLIWSLTKVTVLGREQLAELEPPFIVVANHSSHSHNHSVNKGLHHSHSRSPTNK